MADIKKILEESKTVAVVGLSDNPERDSYKVASYLLEQGYIIIPVNPNITDWRGIKAYKSLLDIVEAVDIVDVFRRSEFVPEIVDHAIRIGTKTIWMQLGIINQQAAEKAKAAGLDVVMNKCMKVEHSKIKH